VQNVVLVPRNPLGQIVVHIFNEFGCCQDIETGQSRAHTPADNCFHSLPISRLCKAPPSKFGNVNTSENCLSCKNAPKNIKNDRKITKLSRQ